MSVVDNDMGFDYDKAGFCALCHTQIAEFNGSDKEGNPIVVGLLGNYDEVTVRLDDNSLMKVTVCSKCRASFTPEDCQELMESVIRGWDWEVKHKLKWPPERREAHMGKYQKRFITDAVDTGWDMEKKSKIKKPRKSKMEVA